MRTRGGGGFSRRGDGNHHGGFSAFEQVDARRVEIHPLSRHAFSADIKRGHNRAAVDDVQMIGGGLINLHGLFFFCQFYQDDVILDLAHHLRLDLPGIGSEENWRSNILRGEDEGLLITAVFGHLGFVGDLDDGKAFGFHVACTLVHRGEGEVTEANIVQVIDRYGGIGTDLNPTDGDFGFRIQGDELVRLFPVGQHHMERPHAGVLNDNVILLVAADINYPFIRVEFKSIRVDCWILAFYDHHTYSPSTPIRLVSEWLQHRTNKPFNQNNDPERVDRGDQHVHQNALYRFVYRQARHSNLLPGFGGIGRLSGFRLNFINLL